MRPCRNLAVLEHALRNDSPMLAIGRGHLRDAMTCAVEIVLACRVSALCDDILPRVVNPLIVSAIFSLVASTAYGEAWKAVAKSSPANLAKFYLAALVLKLMAGTLVFLIYVLVCDRQNILGFTVIFALFYVMLLVFDCIYFARVEKKSRLS